VIKTILHVIDTTGPGGAETVFIDLVTGLPKDKYRSIVLIRGTGWVHDELCRRGVEPVILDAKGSFNWRYLLALRHLIKTERVELIQAHLLGSNVYASLVGLITGVPVISTFHGAVDIGSNERFMGLKFAAINYGSKSIVAVSESLKRELLTRTPIKPAKLKVIYNGVKIESFDRPHEQQLRQQFSWSKDDIIVGSLGNIRPAKGYDILLEAAALVKQQQPNIRFVIAGQGSGRLFEKLEKMRSDLGLEATVMFLGFNDDPAKFLANLDYFLLASVTEGFSIATIQAMASGVPVLATRSGGPEEILNHGETGWLVEANSSQAIVDGLTILMGDETQCQNMLKQAKVHVAQVFSLQTMLSQYQALY